MGNISEEVVLVMLDLFFFFSLVISILNID